MGVDKATVRFGGLTLLDRSIGCLTRAGCDPVVVLHRRPDALDDFSGVGPVTAHLDLAGGEGPLDGLVTALTITDTPLVVTLPVDLPRLADGDVRRLIEVLVSEPDIDAVGLVDERGSTQHLAAAWRRLRCLGHLRESFDSGQRSVRVAIAGLALEWLPIPADRLLNVNTPADLRHDH
jgi:molybdopterin-guanine dinucleotide biosynthesis protein A